MILTSAKFQPHLSLLLGISLFWDDVHFTKLMPQSLFSLILALSSVSRFCDLLVNEHKLHFSSESKVIWRKQKEECAG